MGQKLYAAPPQFAQSPSFIRQDVPVYRLRSACYFQDRFLEGGTVINATGHFEPNLEMFPLNKLAYESVVKFLKRYDEGGEEWSKETKKAFVQKLPAFKAEWENLNAIARQRGIPLERAAAMPVPIMVKPPEEALFQVADMSIASNIPVEVGAPVLQAPDIQPSQERPKLKLDATQA